MLVSLYYSDLNHLTVETRTNVRLNIVWPNRIVLLLYGLTTNRHINTYVWIKVFKGNKIVRLLSNAYVSCVSL